MKKLLYYGGGYILLSIINNEALSWIVLAVVGWVFLVKIFPTLMEGTK